MSEHKTELSPVMNTYRVLGYEKIAVHQEYS